MDREDRSFEVVGADGVMFPVTAQGVGREVLLVHGGSNGPGDWERVAKSLADRFRVLRYTRFTYRSQPQSAERAMAGEVQEVLSIAATASRPLVAVGHSSGGVVLLESVRTDPSRFAGVLLYEPPVAVDEPLGGDALDRARRALDAGDSDRAMTIFLREIVEVPRLAVGLLRLVRPLWRRLRRYAPAQITDTESIESLGVGLDRYSAVPVPVLLLGGGLLSPSHARARMDALASTLPNLDARVTMRLHGHGAYYSAPGRVARIIRDFAERTYAGA